jgi:hypothetical protein
VNLCPHAGLWLVWVRKQDEVALSLVVAFGVIVFGVISQRAPERLVADQDQPG